MTFSHFCIPVALAVFLAGPSFGAAPPNPHTHVKSNETYSGTYAPPMIGECVGSGGLQLIGGPGHVGPLPGRTVGPHVKVNGRFATEHTREMCENECNDLGSSCVGYSYCKECDGGKCILHGPRLDGSCSSSSAVKKLECEKMGTCSIDNMTKSEQSCGECTEMIATEKVICDIVGGNWTLSNWTKSGGVWTNPEDPWKPYPHHNTIIAGSTNDTKSQFLCFDKDPTDHTSMCMGNATDPDLDCAMAFYNMTEAEKTEHKCPKGCTFKPSRIPRPHPHHKPAVKLPGWDPVKAGICRGGTNSTERVNGKYSNTAGANGGALTQEECAKACVDEKMCIGYSHSEKWCFVYGKRLHKSPGTNWTGDEHDVTDITGTHDDLSFICVTGPPRDGKGDGVDPSAGDKATSAGMVLSSGGVSIIGLAFVVAGYLM